MSIALDTIKQHSFEPPENITADRRRKDFLASENSSGSSSIGEDSGGNSGEDSGEDCGEVESVFKGPFDCLEELEAVLPIKRGVSKFYSGKSKSFTSLADVSCSSIKEIVKPENALTRKRKNLLAHATFFDKNRNFPPTNKTGCILKKPTNLNRSTSTASSNEGDNSDTCNSKASSTILNRPPLHPQSKKSPNYESSASPICRDFSPWRSFSLSDLQGAATTPTSDLMINRREVTSPSNCRQPAVI